MNVKDIKEGLVFRATGLSSSNLESYIQAKLINTHMRIEHIEWCNLCSCYHYRAKFITDIVKGTPKSILNHSVRPEEMAKANTIIIGQE